MYVLILTLSFSLYVRGSTVWEVSWGKTRCSMMRRGWQALKHVCSLSVYCKALWFCVCLVKWFYRLYCLVLTKLTLKKMDKWLKKIPAKKLQIEANTNNTSTREQENGRANTSTLTTSSSLAVGQINSKLWRLFER